jgi:uncharacterized membrane protein
MTGNDFFSIVLWWLSIFLLGLVFLPPATRFFSRFFDRGYLFAKTMGIALTSYGVWLGASLHLVPFARWSILLVLILGGLATLFAGRIVCSEKQTSLPWRIFILEEVLFFLGILFWAFIRGLQPEIQGLEKFMDYGFVNSILRARFMPPADMWLAGKTINYYYFGHFVTAFLTRWSGLPSSVTYNLMISTLFAFAFTLPFSLGANLLYLLNGQKFKRVLLAGFISAALVAFGGNLHTAIYAYAVPLAKNIGLYSYPVKAYWYPDATRYIGYNPPTGDKTIHEFPLYSFVVADIHGHVLDIPFVMTFLAILLVFLTRPENPEKSWRKRIGEGLLLGFWLTIFYITNAWDFPIYLMIAGMVLLYLNFLRYRFRFWLKLFGVTLLQVAVIFITFLILARPFMANFVNFGKGIGLAQMHSPLYQLLVLWGYQLFFMLLFIVFLNRKRKSPDGKKIPWDRPDVFVLILCLGSLVLIAIPEVIFMRDIYGTTYARANTMFKLGYQAFICLGLSSGYICVRLLSLNKKSFLQYSLIALMAFVLALPLVFPFYAIRGYYGPVQASRYKQLDGLGFLSRSYPDDFKAITWLKENVPGQPVVLEANGDSYTDYGRVSMATGLPTVLGWFVHEWLWRGTNDPCTRRAGEVAIVYDSLNLWATQVFLKKNKIEYIFIGKLEWNKFPKLKEEKLLGLGKVVFQSGTTKVIRIKLNSP